MDLERARRVPVGPRYLVLGLLVAFVGASACKPRSNTSAELSAGGAASGEVTSPIDGAVVTNWPAEVKRRQEWIKGYLTNPGNLEGSHFPANVAYEWFNNDPLGFGGVPFVLLKTIMQMPEFADIWGNAADKLGMGPHPDDYIDGVAVEPAKRKHQLPFGFVFKPQELEAKDYAVPYTASYAPQNSTADKPYELQALLNPFGATEAKDKFKRATALVNSATAIARIAKEAAELVRGAPYAMSAEDVKATWQKPTQFDNVFFSCAACHTGRVMVDGKMQFLVGAPNTEIEAQYFSKMLLETAKRFVVQGTWDVQDPKKVQINQAVVLKVAAEMFRLAAVTPEVFYGKNYPNYSLRARRQAVEIALTLKEQLSNVIKMGFKVDLMYNQLQGKIGYAASPNKAAAPDLFGDRPGQMDAFGVASGLVALHAKRASADTPPKPNEFFRVPDMQYAGNPFFEGFVNLPGPLAANLRDQFPNDPEKMYDAAAKRIFATAGQWMPPNSGVIDIKSLYMSKERVVANWDGNQGAEARVLASGLSAVGEPSKVNTRIHAAMNPLINGLPAPAYPFASVDLAKATAGAKIFASKCADCHKPHNAKIYPATVLGVDPMRSQVTSDVSRMGSLLLVREACTIYRDQFEKNNPQPWCLPAGDRAAQDDQLFADIPKRVRENTNGYKADVLHGVWSQAPYLHNGSVPTLAHLLCSASRPTSFVRGNINYDQKLVGFVWDKEPQRYSTNDSVHFKRFDATKRGLSNAGHTFADDLCPQGLAPGMDGDALFNALANTQAGALLEYLKTL